jgi:hypothetical protein
MERRARDVLSGTERLDVADRRRHFEKHVPREVLQVLVGRQTPVFLEVMFSGAQLDACTRRSDTRPLKRRRFAAAAE